MEDEEGRLRVAAERGTASATGLKQVARDAVEDALEAYRLATWKGRVIADPETWVFKVAANVARHRAERTRRLARGSPSALGQVAQERTVPGNRDDLLAEVGKWLRRRSTLLTPKQLQAVRLVLAGHTFAAAARKSGTDRSTFRKRFWRAVSKLRVVENSPPPPLLEGTAGAVPSPGATSRLR